MLPRGDIAEVRTREGKLSLFVGIDRTSKFAVTQLADMADRKTAWEVLEHLLETVPWAAFSFGGFPNGFGFDSRSKTEAILSRRTLNDAQWARIEPLVPGKKGDRGRTGTDNRLFVDAIPWLARTASPWRDLPPELGNWRTAHCRFRRWTLAGVWESLFNALSQEPDFEYVLVDATICKAHADASGAKGGLRLTRLGVPKAA